MYAVIASCNSLSSILPPPAHAPQLLLPRARAHAHAVLCHGRDWPACGATSPRDLFSSLSLCVALACGFCVGGRGPTVVAGCGLVAHMGGQFRRGVEGHGSVVVDGWMGLSSCLVGVPSGSG